MIYRTLYVAALEKTVRFHIVSLSNYTHSKQTYLWGGLCSMARERSGSNKIH
jgi:hypothetical protein